MKRLSRGKVLQLAALAVLCLCLALLVTARIRQEKGSGSAAASSRTDSASEHNMILTADNDDKKNVAPAVVEGVLISEVMPKNRAAYRDENGDFPDYVELYNSSAAAVDISGWSLSDKAGKSGWTIPDGTLLEAGEYKLFLADGTDTAATQLHTDFSLSYDETVSLYDNYGRLISALSCSVSQPDAVMLQSPEGVCAESLYPTPGRGNDISQYIAWQETFSTGGLIINEVVVDNRSVLSYDNETPDWLEIKNTGSSPVQLSGCYLSDDELEPRKWSFPEYSLPAGAVILVLCDSEYSPEQKIADGKLTLNSALFSGTVFLANFSLGSQHEQLYLSDGSGLLDWVSVKDVPYLCSYGRMPGKNGFFYFGTPTPAEENVEGLRYVASGPVTLEPDGVFNNVSAVTVELSAPGTIYYTTDGTAPTEASTRYSGPVTVDKTTVIRALSVESGAMNSRTAAFSYILNENLTMPVVSLVFDDFSDYEEISRMNDKTRELPANIAFFEDDGTFSLGGTVRLTGDASLGQPKKGMRIKFSGAFGAEKLNYDLFGGDITEFDALSLRTGNDNISGYIRDEIAQDLSFQFTDRLVSQHGRYVIAFLNGQYWGIYCLKEKTNRQYIADCAGVSKDSLERTTMEDVRVYQDANPFYKEVYSAVINKDMSVQENYERVCQVMDIDCFIDWCIVQGHAANWDMFYRNITFYRSSETDNKWRIVLFDLDQSYMEDNLVCCFRNVYNYNYGVSYMAQMNQALLKNAEYREKFITACARALNTVYTNDNVMKKILELQAIIEPEAQRDRERWELSYKDYLNEAEEIRNFISSDKRDYRQHCIDTICDILLITEEEFRAHYTG